WAVLARLKVPGSWLAAAIFALHPVQVESVAWITERKNGLMGFFFLLTLLTWIAFVNERTRRQWIFYCLALGFYVLALSAKATACTLPAALFLILWLQKKPITPRRLMQVVPFVILGVGMGLLVVWWEHYHQGTNRAAFTFLSPMERILVASRAVWFYLSKIFCPSKLTFIYTFVADHYQYLACIGPIALLSAGLVSLSGEFPQYRAVIMSAALLVVASLGTLTWRQARTYSDAETLWRTTLARNPECWMAHTNIGLVLFQKGQIDEAIAHYRSALQMQPDWWDAEYNLGTALSAKGQIDEAILHSEKAVSMRPADPDARVSLANLLFQKGRIDEAIAHYQKAITVRPADFPALYALGHALLEKGELDSAIQVCRSALLLRPLDADCHTTLAIALEEKGNPEEAVLHYNRALELAPESIPTLTNLAWLLATSQNASLRNGLKAVALAKQAHELVGGT